MNVDFVSCAMYVMRENIILSSHSLKMGAGAGRTAHPEFFLGGWGGATLDDTKFQFGYFGGMKVHLSVHKRISRWTFRQKNLLNKGFFFLWKK